MLSSSLPSLVTNIHLIRFLLMTTFVATGTDDYFFSLFNKLLSKLTSVNTKQKTTLMFSKTDLSCSLEVHIRRPLIHKPSLLGANT